MSCIEGFNLDKDTNSCNNPNRAWIILGVFLFSLSLLAVFVLCCHFVFDRKVTGIYDEDDQETVAGLLSQSGDAGDESLYGSKVGSTNKAGFGDDDDDEEEEKAKEVGGDYKSMQNDE